MRRGARLGPLQAPRRARPVLAVAAPDRHGGRERGACAPGGTLGTRLAPGGAARSARVDHPHPLTPLEQHDESELRHAQRPVVFCPSLQPRFCLQKPHSLAALTPCHVFVVPVVAVYGDGWIGATAALGRTMGRTMGRCGGPLNAPPLPLLLCLVVLLGCAGVGVAAARLPHGGRLAPGPSVEDDNPLPSSNYASGTGSQPGAPAAGQQRRCAALSNRVLRQVSIA